MRCKYIILVLIIFSGLMPGKGPDRVHGQSQAAENKFQFTIDYSRFRYSDSLTYLELYAAIPRQPLAFLPHEGRFKAEYIARAEIFAGDSLYASKVWKSVNYAERIEEVNPDQILFCLNYFILPPGQYEASLQVEDGNNPQTLARYRFPLEITSYSGSDLQLSDMQISSSITRDTTRTPFLKNGFHVTPNPAGTYGLGLPILFLYSEIYHLAPATSDSGGKYSIAYKVYDASGQLAKQVDARLRSKPGESAVEVTSINVVTLVSGAYRVVAEVRDLETGITAAGVRKFFVYREADYEAGGAAIAPQESGTGERSAGLDADRYGVMSAKQLDDEFEWTRYISTKEERDTYKKLNLEGKRKFIKEFWAQRDPSPGTPENEYKRTYLGQVTHANQAFRGTFREGWRTDRGRVLLVYGAPDETERFPFSNDNRAYEIWHYYSLQGGVQFYFVDKRDTGELELVHSTARGELYDLEWERWINPNQ